MAGITKCKVRMYRAGTGDCFLLKFYAGNTKKFTMMIDGGVWKGSGEYLEYFAKDIKESTDGKLDLLVITHEHQDHVLMFERCADIFKSFDIESMWLGWTEDDSDKKVKEWKKNYGEKRKALSLAAERLNHIIEDETIKLAMEGDLHGEEMFAARAKFGEVLNGFADLHASKEEKEYKGSLKGMHVIKNELNVKNIRYCRQGEIINDLNELEGINFYILGPPNLYDEVQKEAGKKGEGYDHNKDLDENDLLAAALHKETSTDLPDHLLPFDRSFIAPKIDIEAIKMEDKNRDDYIENPETSNQYFYNQEQARWRTIENDWLFSAGSLALRMNSLTNNLSLALAIEFEDSKKVMLFPGDAEFGSWESWHKINWNKKGMDNKHLTEDLLNRTIFYKVAHHLSHNGTAKEIGLDMMTANDLVAMATLDYENISSGWKNTMPNRAILKDLVNKTKGRFIVMNMEGVFYDLSDKILLSAKIEEAKGKMNLKEKASFAKSYNQPVAKKIKHKKGSQSIEEEKVLYYEFMVDGK